MAFRCTDNYSITLNINKFSTSWDVLNMAEKDSVSASRPRFCGAWPAFRKNGSHNGRRPRSAMISPSRDARGTVVRRAGLFPTHQGV